MFKSPSDSNKSRLLQPEEDVKWAPAHRYLQMVRKYAFRLNRLLDGNRAFVGLGGALDDRQVCPELHRYEDFARRYRFRQYRRSRR